MPHKAESVTLSGDYAMLSDGTIINMHTVIFIRPKPDSDQFEIHFHNERVMTISKEFYDCIAEGLNLKEEEDDEEEDDEETED